MKIDNFLNNDGFSDAMFLNDDSNACLGVFIPYDFALMYPSGQIP